MIIHTTNKWCFVFAKISTRYNKIDSSSILAENTIHSGGAAKARVNATCSIQWQKEQKIPISQIRPCLAEMKRTSQVSEVFYDSIDFPIDKDSQGNSLGSRRLGELF